MSLFLDILSNGYSKCDSKRSSLYDIYVENEVLDDLRGIDTNNLRFKLQDQDLQIYRAVLFIQPKGRFAKCYEYRNTRYVVFDVFGKSDLEAKKIAKKVWSLVKWSQHFSAVEKIEIYRTNSLRYYAERFFKDSESDELYQDDNFVLFDQLVKSESNNLY